MGGIYFSGTETDGCASQKSIPVAKIISILIVSLNQLVSLVDMRTSARKSKGPHQHIALFRTSRQPAAARTLARVHSVCPTDGLSDRSTPITAVPAHATSTIRRS